MSVEETKRVAVQRGGSEGGDGGPGAGMSTRNGHEPFLRTLADDVQPVDSAVAATAVGLLFSEANEVELAFLMRLIAEGDTATASRIAQRIVAGKTSVVPPEQPKAASISMPPQLRARAQTLVAQPVSSPVRAKRTRVVPPSGPDRQAGMLSPRELSVLRMISQGLSNREIAEASYRSTHTVDAQVKNIYRKLGVKSRAQAVRDAMQKDLLNPRAGA